jgi:hypothetical protein
MKQEYTDFYFRGNGPLEGRIIRLPSYFQDYLYEEPAINSLSYPSVISWRWRYVRRPGNIMMFDSVEGRP